MPVDVHELDGAWYVSRNDVGMHIDILEETEQSYEIVSFGLEDLKCKFEELSSSVNAVLLKLQECARREELVDDMGGSLDEFIESFVVH